MRPFTFISRYLFLTPSLRFSKRLTTYPSIARQRWIDTFGDWLDAITREADNRERGKILGLKELIDLRRGNSGGYTMFALIECILGISLEPEVFDHPVLSNLTRAAVDLVMIANVGPPVLHLVKD